MVGTPQKRGIICTYISVHHPRLALHPMQYFVAAVFSVDCSVMGKTEGRIECICKRKVDSVAKEKYEIRCFLLEECLNRHSI